VKKEGPIMGEAMRAGPQEPPATKECRFCLERIDARAERCPYCQSWQTRTGARGMPGWAIGLIIMVAALATLTPMLLFTDLFKLDLKLPEMRIESFEDHRSGVKVVDVEMSFDNQSVILLGKIRNETSFDWNNLELEVTFRDGTGKVIDTANEACYFKVPAGQERTFKVDTIRARPVREYASFGVRVASADHAKW
jgi:RNA polymerase subunit RPABC4/transcription elongation factor Spt4